MSDKNAHLTDNDFENFLGKDHIALQKATNHLFVIGIDNYTNDVTALTNCVNGAREFVEILEKKYHFEPKNKMTFYDEEATYENLIYAFEKYTSLTEDDNLLIYFSGHGSFHAHTGLGYLLPVDAKKDKVHTFLHNLITKAYIKAYKAKHILFVVDSCYSGAFLLKDDKNEIPPFSVKSYQLASRWVLAAGHLEPVSDGASGENSPFTQAIVSYLKANQAKTFPISELVQHVKMVTANNAKQTPIGRALQDAGDEGGEFVFLLRNSDKKEFEACENKQDYQRFLQNHKDSRFVPEATEKINTFLHEEARELYAKIAAAKWQEKPQLCKQFKDNYKDINRDLYKEVIKEGKKAADFLAWQKVNKQYEYTVEDFVLDENHANNFFLPEAKALLVELEKQNSRLEEAEAKGRKKEQDKKAALEAARIEKENAEAEAERRAKEDPFYGLMVKIPAGSFERGGQKVSVKAFEMCKYQVTQKQWQEIVDASTSTKLSSTPSSFKGENLPV